MCAFLKLLSKNSDEFPGVSSEYKLFLIIIIHVIVTTLYSENNTFGTNQCPRTPAISST